MATPDSAIQSICILRLSAIGDVCHAIATVQAIQKTYPNAEITWVIGKIEVNLMASLPGIRFVVFDKKQGWRAFLQLKKALPQTFDVLLHMQVALRANIAAMMIKAKRKIGFPKHLSKELHSLAVNETVTLKSQPHVLEGFQAFAYAIGVPEFQPSWHIPLDDKEFLWVNEQVKSNKPLFVLAPAASKAERNWLPERYAAVADYASSLGFFVVISGGPSAMEKQLASDILANMQSPAINLVGKSNLMQLFALLKQAAVVLSPDTGPAHMAVTQGTPVIGLYAHSNPNRTGPYLYLPYVVEVYQQHLQQQFAKNSNQLKWGTRVKGENLMADIAIEQVCNMLDKVIVQEGIVLKV